MHLCRNNGRLSVEKYPVGEILNTFENRQLALVAMQLQLSLEINDCLRLVKDLRRQHGLVTRAIQNLYVVLP